jgi:hypothetical protein
MSADLDVVHRMARREAAGHLLRASYGRTVRIRPVVRACPWCGADTRPDWAFPLRAWEPGHDWAPATDGEVTLELLGCERLTARALLPLVEAARTGQALEFRTRAATWLYLDAPGLTGLDAVEADCAGPVTLAASTSALPGPGPSAFLGPHLFPEYADTYRRTRLAAVAEGLRAPAPISSRE